MTRSRPDRDRDVGAFDQRAERYDQGRLGRLHHEIADRTARLVEASSRQPRRILDVGCGTGYLLGQLARRAPAAERLSGVDPAPAMVAAARASDAAKDPRVEFSLGVAEQLPYSDGAFDLVVSTTSFDHWSDQRRGLAECRRVLAPGGQLILVDQFSLWLVPTLLLGRRVKARTKRRANRLLADAGFHPPAWSGVYNIINAAIASARPD